MSFSLYGYTLCHNSYVKDIFGTECVSGDLYRPATLHNTSSTIYASTHPDDYPPASSVIFSAFLVTSMNFTLIKDKINDINQDITDLIAGTTNLSFSGLDDTPDTMLPNKLLYTNNTGNGIDYVSFGSDSDLDPADSDTILFDYSVAGKIIIKADMPDFDAIISGLVPEIGSETIDMQKNFIFNSGYLTQNAIDQYNTAFGKTLQLDDAFISKRFADMMYYTKNNPIIMKGNQTSYPFELVISSYSNGYAIINNHGLNKTYNGIQVVFMSDSNTPAMLNNGGVYYIRYKDGNRVSLHSNENDAMEQDDNIAHNTRINLAGSPSSNNHNLTFKDLDSSLSGGYLKSQAVPRKDLVLRDGDTMTGPLILHDHPSPLNGEEMTDDALQAATKYYVEELSSSNKQLNSAREYSKVSLEKNDLLGATGYRRLLVTDTTIGDWNIGQSFECTDNILRNGIVQDIKTVAPNSLYIITYITSNNHPEKNDIITNGAVDATVLDNFPEFSQVRNAADSNISIDISRSLNAEKSNTGPVSEIEFTIKDGVISDRMISSGATISQDKVDLNLSSIFIETDSSTGWTSTPTHKKSVVGLSAFSDQNFESSNGFIRIKPHGIALTDIVKVPDNTVLGTTDIENNNVVPISFSYVVEQGGGITNNNLDTLIFDKFDPNIFTYSSDVLSLKNNGIVVSKLQKVDSNTLLGRKTAGFGDVEVLTISDVLSEVGGLTASDLSIEFTMISDVLHLAPNKIDLNKLIKIPSMTVLGNNWNADANVAPISMSKTADPLTIVYRKDNGEISCNELQLSNKKALYADVDSLMAYTPTGQLIFTSLCGDSCSFNMADTEFNGSVTATDFVEISDSRKKENIQQIYNAVDIISNLRGVTFNWKANKNPSMGLIAQEVEQIIPSVVHTDQYGYKSISYTNLIGLLVEGVKEVAVGDLYTVPGFYEQGTVVVIGEEYECETTDIKNNKNVLGIVKYCIMDGHNKIELYNKGKAKCKVLGDVVKGDLLVTASIPGYAIVDNNAHHSAIIGKSLTNKTSSVKETIDIFVV